MHTEYRSREKNQFLSASEGINSFPVGHSIALYCHSLFRLPAGAFFRLVVLFVRSVNRTRPLFIHTHTHTHTLNSTNHECNRDDLTDC